MILSRLKQLTETSVKVLYARCVHWTKPLTSPLPLGTLADLGRSKSELIAENALLRQQLIVLKRQVKRPVCTKADRVLLVLLARVVRAWKQALIIVQPETLLRWHREAFRLYCPRGAQREVLMGKERKSNEQTEPAPRLCFLFLKQRRDPFLFMGESMFWVGP